MYCVKAWVSGRVQGVFFRDSTRQQALGLGITGHALNLPDGRVEVLACGEKTAVETLLRWLEQGPELARVDGLEFETVDQPAPEGFLIG